MDVSEGNTYLEWKVNNHLMQRWKDPKCKLFASPQFNAIGETWRIVINPKGAKAKGTADFWVVCKPFESDEKEINVCHYIGIHALNYHQINFDGNNVTKKENEVDFDSPFKWNDIQNELEITICVKLWEKGSINNDQVQLISNIHEEKMRKANAET
eukprot:280237_1